MFSRAFRALAGGILSLIVVVLQLFVGNLLGFGLAFNLGIGNGWELAMFWLGSSLGVWGLGLLSLALRGRMSAQALRSRFLITVAGSAIGVALLLLQAQLSTPPLGLGAALLPLLGALMAFYLPDLRPVIGGIIAESSNP